MRKQMHKDNWQPAVAGVKAKGKNKVITKGKRKHKGMSKDKGKGKDDVTKGMSKDGEERRAFLEAFERDGACRKRDDALEAACLAYESDYSQAETLSAGGGGWWIGYGIVIDNIYARAQQTQLMLMTTTAMIMIMLLMRWAHTLHLRT